MNTDIDFYSIEEYGDGKYINPNGYYYYTDDTEKPYRFATYHRIMKLDEFLTLTDEEKEEWLCATVKYIYDLTEDEFIVDSNKDMNESEKIPYVKLTVNTPVGYYHT